MLEILKQKILSWNPDTADQFHGNITRYHSDPGQMWELTSTGYYLYSPNKAELRDYNGVRYELAQGDFTDQLDFKKELADLLDTKPGVKLEKPTFVVLTDIYGIPYTYSRQVNPEQTRGIPVVNLKDVKSDESSTYVSLLQEVMKCAEELVLAIDELTGSTSEMRYPETLNYESFVLDTTTNKFFLSGNMNMTASRELFIDQVNHWISESDHFASTIFNKPMSVTAQLSNYSTTQCTIYQPQ